MALIAYDCHSTSTNITAISLREVQLCPDPETGYNSSSGSIQILEKRRFELIHVYSCLIEVSRIITYCGAFSHMSIVSEGVSSYIYQIGSEECRRIHQYREFRGLGGNIISKLAPNSTTSTSLTLAGAVDDAGRCEGSPYSENGKTYKNVVVTAAVKITLKDYRTRVDLGNNEIKLRDGLTCPFKAGYCMDYDAGETTWEQIAEPECNRFNVLYEGQATFITERSDQANQFIVVEDHMKIFALKLIRKTTLCGYAIWESEHPRLMVAPKVNPFATTPWESSEQSNEADLVTYVNTKFLYVEQSFKRTIDSMFTQTIYRRCLLKRDILKNRLAMAPLTPNVVATLFQNQLGYVAKVAGEVLYVMKCRPVMVEVRRTKGCYAQLPVTVSNKTMFMSPVTRILQEHAEEIECTSIIPPMYYIHNKWIGFDPYPVIGLQPQELKADEEPYQFDSIKNLGSGGIYTDTEIHRAQDAMMFNMERPALNNILLRKMAGQPIDSQGFTTLSLFDAKEMEKIASSTLQRLYGWFTILGDISSGILGLYVTFRIVKFVFETTLNALAIHKAVGCSFHMLASFWDTLTLFILQRKEKPGKDVSTSSAPPQTERKSSASTPSESREYENQESVKLSNNSTRAEATYFQVREELSEVRQLENIDDARCDFFVRKQSEQNRQ